MTKGGTDKSKYLKVTSVLVKRITLKVPKSLKAEMYFIRFTSEKSSLHKNLICSDVSRTIKQKYNRHETH